MAKVEVILTSSIVGLGAESDQVKVNAGYARNYLFPQGMAIPMTQSNKKRLEALRKRRAEREASEFNTMTELAKALSKLVAVIAVKTGDDGKIFGTVTSGSIADQLKTQFDIVLDKRKIHLELPIKGLGDYEVELRLHPEIKGTLKVRVESTTPPPSAAEGAVKEGEPGEKTEKGRPDRFGRPDRKFRKPGTETVEAPKADKPVKVEKTEKPKKSAKAA